jgi:hypothetical protein
MSPRRSPSVEGGPAQRGEPDDRFPGGRGARGDILSEADERVSRNWEKSHFISAARWRIGFFGGTNDIVVVKTLSNPKNKA